MEDLLPLDLRDRISGPVSRFHFYPDPGERISRIAVTFSPGIFCTIRNTSLQVRYLEREKKDHFPSLVEILQTQVSPTLLMSLTGTEFSSIWIWIEHPAPGGYRATDPVRIYGDLYWT